MSKDRVSELWISTSRRQPTQVTAPTHFTLIFCVGFVLRLLPSSFVDLPGSVLRITPTGRGKLDYMTGTTEGLPMDVAKDARGEKVEEEEKQGQREDQKKELDRNESVRARLVAISRVEPVGEEVFVDEAIQEVKESPRARPAGGGGDTEDEVRRRLMAISSADVPHSAQ